MPERLECLERAALNYERAAKLLKEEAVLYAQFRATDRDTDDGTHWAEEAKEVAKRTTEARFKFVVQNYSYSIDCQLSWIISFCNPTN